MNPRVDIFLNKATRWREEMKQLRRIILDCGLTEELKWGKPCYTFLGKNVILIHGFKDYCAILFHKGALLKDENHILIQQTKNVQAARQIRFTKTEEILALEPVIKAYVFEAIEAERAGLEVKLKKTSEFEMAEEFREALDASPDLKRAFESLTPGRQRAYLLYFSGAKQAKTRGARVEKYKQKILDGKGMND